MCFDNKINIYNNDCFEIMKTIPDRFIDLIICDPPYGTTPLNWDTIIDFNELWNSFYRIMKPTTPVLFFGQEPFASKVRLSNLKDYKYDWYWEKERLTNVFQVKRRPGKNVENIMVFYKEQCVYKPQKTERIGKSHSNKVGDEAKMAVTLCGNKSNIKPSNYIDDGTRYPKQTLKINRDCPIKRLHPTQKPVELLEYFIKTYTNENAIILDPTMGSGSTGVACLNLNVKFIGIEKDKTYFEIAKNRLENHSTQKNIF